MTHHLQGHCPLCGKPFLRIELHAHIMVENSQTRQDIIKAIKSHHPDWGYEHGACENCWDTNRAQSQIQGPPFGMKAGNRPEQRA